MQQSIKAYLLVQTERWGTTVAERLRAIPGVLDAHDVTGPYDALALVSSDDEGGGLHGILDAVRDVPGVLRVLAAPLLASEDRGSRVDAA
jgi:DNA-binding Lrp family transcriptional regulator